MAYLETYKKELYLTVKAVDPFLDSLDEESLAMFAEEMQSIGFEYILFDETAMILKMGK